MVGAALAADYNSAGAPRAADRDLGNPWESTSTASQRINADLGAIDSISSLVLGNHNLSGCSISLQKSPNGVDTWSTVDSWTPGADGNVSRAFTPTSERYFRLDIQNATVNPQVGEWWLCNGVAVFPQYLPDFDPGEEEQSAVVEFGSVAAETRERFSYRRFQVRLRRTTRDFADEVIDIFKEAGTRPFWFDWDGSGVPVYVRLENPELRARGTGKGRVSLDISMLEVLAVGEGYDSTAEQDKAVNEPVFACKLELFNKPIFGRATGGSGSTLVDSAADFVDRGVQVGDVAYNETDGINADITSIGITTLVIDSDASFESGDKYVIRANTWDDDPNMETFWLTQEQLFPGCYPIVKQIGAVEEKVDYDRGLSIVGGLNLELMEWQEENWLRKLIARKTWGGAKVHLYRGYKVPGVALASTDLDFKGTYRVTKAVGTDTVRLRLDSFLGLLQKPAQKTAELFQLDYLGTDRVEISVNGATLKIWINDVAEPEIDYDLTSDAYSSVAEVRDALQNHVSFSASAVSTDYTSEDSTVINDLERVHIDPNDGLVINGLQKTYSGSPEDVFYALMLAAGITVSQLDMYDVELQLYWVFDWRVEQRPSLEKTAFVVMGEFMISCGGWLRTGLKRDIPGTHSGSDNSATLVDSKARFVRWGVLAGDTIFNVTDGSSGIITARTATSITIGGGLSGGTDDDFDTDDEYRIEAAPREVFSCRILAPGIPGEINQSITSDHIVEGGLGVDHQPENYKGTCEVQYRYDPVEKKYLDTVVVEDPENLYHSEAETGDTIFKTFKIKAPWLRGAGASVRAGILAERRLYWQRTNSVQITVRALLNRDEIEPGDTILLTSSLLPAVDGQGVTAHKFLVIRKKINPDLKNRYIDFVLQEADFGGDSPFILAPDDTPDWTSASDEEKEKYGFLTDGKGLMSDGTEGKVLY